MKNKNVPLVLVEAGDLLSAPPIDKSKNMTCLKIVKNLGYDALNIGEQDILDDNTLSFDVPYISANLKRSGPAATLTPYIIKKLKNNIKVAIIGITDKASFNALPPDKTGLWIVDDPIPVLQNLVPKVQKEADAIILLAHVNMGVENIIAQTIKGINLIISSHGSRNYGGGGVKIGNTILVNTDIKGQRVGKIELHLNEKNVVANYKDELIPLEPSIEDDTTIKNIIKQSMNDIHKIAFVPPPIIVDVPKEMIGSNACYNCHKDEYRQWSMTGHAKAFESLKNKGRSDDKTCIPCHTTNYKTEKINAGVECLICHATKDKHGKETKTVENHTDKAYCEKCHTVDNSPDFNYTEFHKKIVHK